KMLPFDNKSELQVMIRMPEDTPLEATAGVAGALADEALRDPAVTSVQSYAGTASPYTFNGMVRHYFLRQDPHLADLQVVLRPRDERTEQSHAVAVRLRERLAPLASRLGARIQIVEVPPGPPVLQTLVAEVYGPDPDRRAALAEQVRAIFEQTPGVVDIDWHVEEPHGRLRLEVDDERAAIAGRSAGEVASLVSLAGRGMSAGLLHDARAREDVPIVLRLPRERRGSLDAMKDLRLTSLHGESVAVGELVDVIDGQQERSIHHKNLRPVTYVTGEVSGEVDSPVYAILGMNRALATIELPEGYAFDVFNATQPDDSTKYAMKWEIGRAHV